MRTLLPVLDREVAVVAAAPAGESGQRLRRVRQSRGLSLRGLARLADMSPATLSAFETGRRRISSVGIAKVAQALGTTVDEIASPSLPRQGDGTGGDSADRGLTGPADAAWRRFEPMTLDPPLAAALEAFVEFGYHGATMRDIARRAGLSVPGVYHYYQSKQDMLVALLDVTMDDLLARTTAARGQGRNPVERFALLVECLALFHTHRRELGFLGASEMRSLDPQQRSRLAAIRRAQQRMVDEEVEQACHVGSFAVTRPHEASRAVVTMCTALPQWFDGDGPSTAEEVAAQYVEFALDLMRCTPAGRRRI